MICKMFYVLNYGLETFFFDFVLFWNVRKFCLVFWVRHEFANMHSRIHIIHKCFFLSFWHGHDLITFSTVEFNQIYKMRPPIVLVKVILLLRKREKLRNWSNLRVSVCEWNEIEFKVNLHFALNCSQFKTNLIGNHKEYLWIYLPSWLRSTVFYA